MTLKTNCVYRKGSLFKLVVSRGEESVMEGSSRHSSRLSGWNSKLKAQLLIHKQEAERAEKFPKPASSDIFPQLGHSS